MDLSRYAELFLTETRERLGACNELLLEWERHPDNLEPVGGLFRAIHTIKGMAATMGYGPVADLAHRTESLLDVVRRGDRQADQDVLDLLFRAIDRLETVIERTVQGEPLEESLEGIVAALDRAARLEEPAARPMRMSESTARAAPSGGAGRPVAVTLEPSTPLMGARALLVLKLAEALGSVAEVQPAAGALEADTFDGRFNFQLTSDEDDETIVARLGGAGDVQSVTVGTPEPSAPSSGARTPARTRHVRVAQERLDALMNLIGELVIARGRLADLSARRADPELEEVGVQFSRLTGELQAEIVQARMTPVWQAFDRLPRLVRDLARQLGRQVAFRVEGKEIELDRAILDELIDPLTHLLRNAIDHGVEPAEERLAAGKPAEGQLILSATRESSRVSIRVSDDGRGIDRAAVLRRAKADEWVDKHVDVLTDDLLLRVLARPGFSTSSQVSEVSGRGVGMEIVATQIRALGGSLDITTEVGRGTTFTLRLPISLAIVRAILALIGSERYALPLTHVVEIVDFDSTALTTIEGRDVLLVRDQVVPLVHLDSLLGVQAPASAESPPLRSIIVLELGDRRTGVVVDRMLGQQEIVVKGFTAPTGTLPVFSGATILGDGTPALILDAGGLV